MAKDENGVEPMPTSPTELHNASTADGLERDSGEKILNDLRDNQFLSSIADGRDVSMIYIDRRKVQNYYAADAEEVPLRRATASTVPSRRIGDLVVNPVPAWETQMVRYVYQATPVLEFALRRLREHGVVVLHGRAGAGKRATAIYLLSELRFNGGDGLIYELNPSLRMADLRAEDLPPHTALLLEAPDGDALDGLTVWQIKALLNVLADAQRQCALVIVCEQPPKQLGRDFAHLACEWRVQWPEGVAAGQGAVLAQHLRYLAEQQTAPADLEQRLASLLEEPALASLLGEPMDFAQLAELAEVLWPVVQIRQTLVEALAHFDQVAQRAVQEWFRQDHGADLESLLIAAAVFNGAPYTAVSAAAETLAGLLQSLAAPATPEEKPARPASLFAGRDLRRRRLEAIRARSTPKTLRGHYGDVQEEAVELENPAWQEAVLRYVWEFDDLRPSLLEWLQGYGIYGNHHLRTRAAAAIGALARDSFSLIEEQILRQWADSVDPNVRRSAAQILGITIWDETHSAAASRLLHYWASQPNKPRWQWTAAAAYGGLAGLRYPQQTLADLKLIAGNTRHNPALLQPIFQALVTTYGAGQVMPELRSALLEALERWSAYQAKAEDRLSAFPLQRTALLSFWVILWPDRRDPVWSQLLSDIGTAGDLQNLGVLLTRRALNFRQRKDSVSDVFHPREFALEGMEALITAVNSHESAELSEHLTSFLGALVSACRAADEDEVDRLNYAARKWKEKEGKTGEMLEVLLNS